MTARWRLRVSEHCVQNANQLDTRNQTNWTAAPNELDSSARLNAAAGLNSSSV
ncbi:MAG: hypothetical protein ACRESJ_32390 [Pseudomonas sp.]|uniref:hypothetical protein n=1 Tax=Pseudomonas sp. TaxID=306 RepID=UPI003D6F7067